MSQVCIILSLVLFSIRIIYGYPGDNVHLPSYEVRSMDPYRSPAFQQYASQFQGNRHVNRPQQVLHTDVIQKRPPQVPVMEKQINQNVTLGEFMAALNEMSLKEEESQLPRAAASGGRDENPTYSSRPIGYSGSSYVAPATYNETPSALTPPPSTIQPKIPLLKPDFSSFLKPVATKASSKLDGLLGLIFSLLTSSSGGMQTSGLKGILIEGIIKPLLTANGGIKAVISKLTIPVICLLLINLEVLITVWWMWDECPAIPKTLPSEPPITTSAPYSKPAYNYNSYR